MQPNITPTQKKAQRSCGEALVEVEAFGPYLEYGGGCYGSRVVLGKLRGVLVGSFCLLVSLYWALWMLLGQAVGKMQLTPKDCRVFLAWLEGSWTEVHVIQVTFGGNDSVLEIPGVRVAQNQV